MNSPRKTAFDLGTSPHGLFAVNRRTVQAMCAVITNYLFLKASTLKVTTEKVPPFSHIASLCMIRFNSSRASVGRFASAVLVPSKVLKCTKKDFDVKKRQLSLTSAIISLICAISATAQAATYNASGLPVPTPVQVHPATRTGTLMMYNTPQTGPVYENSFSSNFPPMIGYPGVKVSPNPAVTPSNAAGYTPSMATGSPGLRTEVPITAEPPPGSPVSSNVNAAALTMAGTGIATGVLVNDIPLGAGVGSLAFNLAMAGGGLALSMAMYNPYGVAMAAAGVGMAGYQLYTALKGEGLAVNPDGHIYDTSIPGAAGQVAVPGVPGQPEIIGYGNWCLGTRTDFCGSSEYVIDRINTPGLGFAPYDWTLRPLNATQYVVENTSGGMNTVNQIPNPVPYVIPAVPAVPEVPAIPPIPPTLAKMEGALVNALQSNTVALDAAALAIATGVNIANVIKSSNAPSTISPMQVKSPFSQITQTTDAVGNTTTTVRRTVVTVPTSAPNETPVPDVRQETVIINNGAPQTITNTPVDPSLLPGLVGGALGGAIGSTIGGAGNPATSGVDICIEHPDILACSNDANVGDVPEAPLEQKSIDVSSITPFTLSSSASCPAPIMVGPGKFFEFSGICTWLSMLNPILKAFAWLGAGMLVFRSRPYA